MSLIAAPFAILAILYAGGFLAQLLGNYATWKQGGGIPGDGTSPLAASPDFFLCLSSVLRPPYGVYGILICIGLLAVLLIMVMRMGYGDAGEYDEDRNFSYSAKGTYGTSGWMSRKEMSGVLDLVRTLEDSLEKLKNTEAELRELKEWKKNTQTVLKRLSARLDKEITKAKEHEEKIV